jgi:hypothetical protein
MLRYVEREEKSELCKIQSCRVNGVAEAWVSRDKEQQTRSLKVRDPAAT